MESKLIIIITILVILHGIVTIQVESALLEETGKQIVIPQSDGFLDAILRPIINSLSGILNPINNTIKNVVWTILKIMQPLLGNIVTANIKNVIFAIVNAVVPCTECTDPSGIIFG